MMLGLMSMLIANSIRSRYNPKFICVRYHEMLISTLTLLISPVIEEFMFYKTDIKLQELSHILTILYRVSLWFPNMKYDNILMTCVAFALWHIPYLLIISPRNKGIRTYISLILLQLITTGLFRYDVSMQPDIFRAMWYHIITNCLCVICYWGLVYKKCYVNILSFGIIMFDLSLLTDNNA